MSHWNEGDKDLLGCIAVAVVKALEDCHDKKILHRDVKPGNILIKRAGYIKLGDFGEAKITDGISSTLSGTYYYWPPEKFQWEKDEMNEKTDIWSFGITLLEAVRGSLPYSTRDLITVQLGVLNLDSEKEVDKAFDSYENLTKTFVKSCLLKYDFRPTCKELKKYPFIKEYESYEPKQIESILRKYKSMVKTYDDDINLQLQGTSKETEIRSLLAKVSELDPEYHGTMSTKYHDLLSKLSINEVHFPNSDPEIFNIHNFKDRQLIDRSKNYKELFNMMFYIKYKAKSKVRRKWFKESRCLENIIEKISGDDKVDTGYATGKTLSEPSKSVSNITESVYEKGKMLAQSSHQSKMIKDFYSSDIGGITFHFPKNYAIFDSLQSSGRRGGIVIKAYDRNKEMQVAIKKFNLAVLNIYIHDRKIIHGSLSPNSILLNKMNELKIADMGCGYLTANEREILDVFAKMSPYRAPEMIFRLSYDVKVDIWSAAVILIELLIGKNPFEIDLDIYKGKDSEIEFHIWAKIVEILGQPSEEFLTQLLPDIRAYTLAKSKGESKNWLKILPDESFPQSFCLPYRTADNARDLISNMLLIDPTDRISISKAMKFPFLLWKEKEDDFKLYSNEVNQSNIKDMDKLKEIVFNKVISFQYEAQDEIIEEQKYLLQNNSKLFVKCAKELYPDEKIY
uniref:mitogen-activated protein kinase kinase n=1 Tax=Acrobeloides nanus TaxID=290746 RepID=A0A914CR67_9BILA